MSSVKADGPEPASFRDPSGHLFWKDNILRRRINECYRRQYEQLMESGLYARLTEKRCLISHEEEPSTGRSSDPGFKQIIPQRIPFISYPYEWCFSQLKDAALLTLRIQNEAAECGMTLKDASAYNIQFIGSRPILIDTLSFDIEEPGRPWVAYRQFCQHFIAPLAIMSYTDIRLGQLSRIHVDGVPLDLAARLLPHRTRLRLGLLTHIHLHARSQKKHADRTDVRTLKTRENALRVLVDHLQSTVSGLEWAPAGTEWGEYYQDTNYSAVAQQHKTELVEQLIDRTGPSTVWDLGANTGRMSRLASDRGIATLAFDVDPAAVEKNYLECKQKDGTTLLPLLLDLTNPSPALGWGHRERASFVERRGSDLVLALALVHHLAIGNNVPLARVSQFLARLGPWLLIEFVPKTDTNTARLLATREDVFPDYHEKGFERAFASRYEIIESHAIHESKRTLYLMKRRNNSIDD